MKIHQVDQGSYDWLRAKIGIPSSSNFERIVTPGKLQLSSQAEKYAWELIAEELLGAPLDDFGTALMSRGTSMEVEARGYYSLTENVDVTPGGFVVRDDGKAGASPDGFVGDDGLLEIKCPSAEVHVGYLLDSQGIGYRIQVQTQLWVCEREWNDTLSYHPTMPKALVRQGRDEKVIKAIAECADRFHELMLDMKDKLAQRYGLFDGEPFPALTLVSDAPTAINGRYER